jgi:hypothetical protein
VTFRARAGFSDFLTLRPCERLGFATFRVTMFSVLRPPGEQFRQKGVRTSVSISVKVQVPSLPEKIRKPKQMK